MTLALATPTLQDTQATKWYRTRSGANKAVRKPFSPRNRPQEPEQAAPILRRSSNGDLVGPFGDEAHALSGGRLPEVVVNEGAGNSPLLEGGPAIRAKEVITEMGLGGAGADQVVLVDDEPEGVLPKSDEYPEEQFKRDGASDIVFIPDDDEQDNQRPENVQFVPDDQEVHQEGGIRNGDLPQQVSTTAASASPGSSTQVSQSTKPPVVETRLSNAAIIALIGVISVILVLVALVGYFSFKKDKIKKSSDEAAKMDPEPMAQTKESA